MKFTSVTTCPCLSGYFSEALWLYIQPQFLKNVLKMTGGCASTKGGVKLLSLPIKVYARVLERRVRALVELRIQEKQYGFHPGCGTLDQFFTLSGILEDAWEFTCALWTWRRHLTMFLGVCCGTCLGNMPLQ